MPQTVTLSARANRFQKWQKDIACAAGTYRTSITLSNLHPGDPFESAAEIILRTPASDGHAMFALLTIHGQPPLRARLDITGSTRDTPQFSQYSDTPLEVDVPIDVEISWASRRGIRVMINGRDQITAPIKGAISALAIEASGGTARFDNNLIECDLIS